MDIALGTYLIVVVIGSLHVAGIVDRGCDWQETLIALALLLLWPLCVVALLVVVMVELWYSTVRHLKARGWIASEKIREIVRLS